MGSKDNETFVQLSTKLADEQARIEAARKEQVSRVALEIEKILVRENMTMNDFGEIVSVFNTRAQTVFAEMKINNIKEQYDRRS